LKGISGGAAQDVSECHRGSAGTIEVVTLAGSIPNRGETVDIEDKQLAPTKGSSDQHKQIIARPPDTACPETGAPLMTDTWALYRLVDPDHPDAVSIVQSEDGSLLGQTAPHLGQGSVLEAVAGWPADDQAQAWVLTGALGSVPPMEGWARDLWNERADVSALPFALTVSRGHENDPALLMRRTSQCAEFVEVATGRRLTAPVIAMQQLLATPEEAEAQCDDLAAGAGVFWATKWVAEAMGVVELGHGSTEMVMPGGPDDPLQALVDVAVGEFSAAECRDILSGWVEARLFATHNEGVRSFVEHILGLKPAVVRWLGPKLFARLATSEVMTPSMCLANLADANPGLADQIEVALVERDWLNPDQPAGIGYTLGYQFV
jgi:hypothetical protein